MRYLILLLFSLGALAQRQKAIQFDSDINVLPGKGRYGISAYKGQPYWINSDTVYYQIKTEAPFIPVWQIGADREDTLGFYSTMVTAWFDSTEIWLPPLDSVKNGWYYHFSFYGIDTDTLNFDAVDNNQILYFPDGIWTYIGKTWVNSNYMSSTHPNSNFALYKNSHFQLYFILPEKRWLLTRKEWHEYNY